MMNKTVVRILGSFFIVAVIVVLLIERANRFYALPLDPWR